MDRVAKCNGLIIKITGKGSLYFKFILCKPHTYLTLKPFLILSLRDCRCSQPIHQQLP